MPDAIFEHPRLAGVYDVFDDDRSDLDAYLAIVAELGATRVLDVGCGTGTFAQLLANGGAAGREIEVTGVDPAGASLQIARSEPGAGRVRWIHGDACALPAMEADLATMTGNVAQAIADPADWARTLSCVRDRLRPGGHLVFETRDPAKEAWRGWNRAASYRMLDVPGVGKVEHWVDLIDRRGDLVTFRGTWIFAADGQRLTSDSTLRFRHREEVEADLVRHGYVVDQVRDAPDRPGLELVFVASRPRSAVPVRPPSVTPAMDME